MFSLSLDFSKYFRDKLSFSSGELATQSNGSTVVFYGETIVLVSACMDRHPKDDCEITPLTVDYMEKTYAMGKIPGGFIKREGRPKDTEILCARLIDRPLRPFFPPGLMNEVQIVAMVLSSDGINDPDVLGINGASCALLISDIPFYTPVGAVRVCKREKDFIINPTYQEREEALFDMVVAATMDNIVMIEGDFNEISEEEILEAIKFAHPAIQEVIKLQLEIKEKIGKPKKEVPLYNIDREFINKIKDIVYPLLDKIYGLVKKEEREDEIDKIISQLQELFKEDSKITPFMINKSFYEIEKEFVRDKILKDGLRPDGRAINEIRKIECKVGVLPRTHGSAIFKRGQTQALAVTTLGTSSDEQLISELEGEKYKHFMLHYTFPPFSVGEVKPLRGPSRREIGHGTLAEKSLLPVIPDKESFPYTIRVVSEILESNGSSSMASVCASSLSLMDAGVPIKEHVAGIALGLVQNNENYKILTDIAGVEDHYGEMDFKIAGTEKGITAIQLDVKNEGISFSILADSLKRAKEARNFILSKMKEIISTPRSMVSPYAPKIKSFKIDIDKIGEIIGPGGRVIRKITRENNVIVDINDETGIVSVVADNDSNLERAVKEIINLTKEVNVGDIYEAKVIKITNFGAFCEILPGKVGLLHISELSNSFVRDPYDFVKENEIIKVKVINIDEQGRISLSKKQAD
ncbi:MAG: polyribonucleotide nucleotidyltransferase [Candidatus Omnitrophica bacterium]|nr:polyribonucleotide nucleotidyltransferase [Candidatus Omnitrophota bacterium]MCM8826117.1 polyribonucleotide nucleotidyltransferase [Candidatus Omnitrophota bacterium]